MELTDVVVRTVAEWPHGCPLARSLLGSDEPVAIAAAFGQWCREHLGVDIAEAHRFAVSVGLVADLTVDDGRRVVVKAVRPTWADQLAGSVRVRRALGFDYPCPAPIVAPVSLGAGVAVADAYLPPGVPAGRTTLAAGLADLVRRLAPLDREGLGRPLAPAPGDDLWPAPHDLRFDFAASAAGAEWIDDVARRARAVIGDPDPRDFVIAHNDWRAEHVHVAEDDDTRIVATYDWDSVTAATEAEFVGQASVVYTCDWSTEPVAALPSPTDADAFVDDYEAAAGRSLDRSVVSASAALLLAYGVRCVHSDVVLLGWPDRADMTSALRAWTAHTGL